MTENRCAPRLKTSMAVAFSSAGDFLCGHIMNISCSGLFINTETVLPPDTELALRIRLPDDLESMDIVGRVVWAKQATKAYPAGMGIEFIRIPLEDRMKIERFVDEQTRELNESGRLKSFVAAAC